MWFGLLVERSSSGLLPNPSTQDEERSSSGLSLRGAGSIKSVFELNATTQSHLMEQRARIFFELLLNREIASLRQLIYLRTNPCPTPLAMTAPKDNLVAMTTLITKTEIRNNGNARKSLLHDQ